MNLSAMNKEQLLEQAAAIELDVPESATKPEIIKLINVALGEEETLEKLDDGHVMINFSKDTEDKLPVFFGLNGKSYRFPRGKWVKCPKILIPTIENCVTRIRDDETGEYMDIQTYPFSMKDA